MQEAYGMLNKFEVSVAREEVDGVDTLRYSFEKLLAQAGQVQSHLVKIQPNFKARLYWRELWSSMTTPLTTWEDYDEIGPMVSGITPQEASERLNMFQSFLTNCGVNTPLTLEVNSCLVLTVTEYPELARTKKELGLLQKLYGLYNAVIDGVNGYYDILWIEVDIEKINNELLDFQNRCRKLPKALKEWQAFNELKKKIDDFNECCPLLELMANKAMKDRPLGPTGCSHRTQV
ncbi:hypothetical protein OS493_040545 [Desmophyllum pertusum]|uniref:Dynein heavy chain linker domain-containing protein n=1 Tax=Desmophyllum pertusum TaxID=174260 RepID=A0A9W9Y6P8_9CNID|nr:hypothetical protein OS493_040545 [Desmophyllum pertusum]